MKNILYAIAATKNYVGLTLQSLTAVFLAIIGFAVVYTVLGPDTALDGLLMLAAGTVAPIALWTLALFGYSLYKSPSALREKATTDDLQDLLEESDLDDIRSAIRLALGSPELHVSAAAFFGSIAVGYEVRDVDLIVIMDAPNQATASASVRTIKSYAREFEALHKHPLHLQFLKRSDKAGIVTFLERAGTVESVFGTIDG